MSPAGVPFRSRLVVMVKEPVGGRVKTRLMRQAGLARSVGFYRRATTALLARVGRDPRWRTVLAVTPDRAVTGTAWPPWLSRVGQGRGDLGVRMQRIFDWLPPGPVVIVGSDIPGITADRIAAAFRLLRSCDAVLGPARDGGYWLVGLRRRPRVPRPFTSVRWSSRHALADTRAALAGYRLGFAATLEDVDELAISNVRAPKPAGGFFHHLQGDDSGVSSRPDNVIAMS